MHIAEEDEFTPKPALAVILAALKDHPQIELHTYPGCNHAFARVGGEHFNAEAAKLANGRTLQFFQKVLG
jgi:carboxymethylenebutenolidase